MGCGKIARKFAGDLKLVKDAELAAVASRDAARAEAFKEDFNAERTFTDYLDLVRSADVDVVYVATPHGLHYDHVMMCLQNHKAVLCEKAFALNYRQAEEMVTTAKKNNIFLMEAFWTRFLPQYQKVAEMISNGELGQVRLIQADFGFKAPEPIAQRLYDPALGGGALLDIGLYPVFLAQSILGEPIEVQALTSPFSSGVDQQIIINLKFRDGALATLCSTFAVDTPVNAMIAGTDGRIHMRNRFHNAIADIELVKDRQKPVTIKTKRERGYGYQFEARHVDQCLREGLTESPVWKHSDTLLLMKTLDRIRNAAGIQYAVDSQMA